MLIAIGACGVCQIGHLKATADQTQQVCQHSVWTMLSNDTSKGLSLGKIKQVSKIGPLSVLLPTVQCTQLV